MINSSCTTTKNSMISKSDIQCMKLRVAMNLHDFMSGMIACKMSHTWQKSQRLKYRLFDTKFIIAAALQCVFAGWVEIFPKIPYSNMTSGVARARTRHAYVKNQTRYSSFNKHSAQHYFCWLQQAHLVRCVCVRNLSVALTLDTRQLAWIPMDFFVSSSAAIANRNALIASERISHICD